GGHPAVRSVDVARDGEPVRAPGDHAVRRTGRVGRGVVDPSVAVGSERSGDLGAALVLPDEDVHGCAPAGTALGEPGDGDLDVVRAAVVEDAREGSQVVLDG